MTKEQQAALDHVFQRYGTPHTEWNETLYLYFTRADKLDTCERVRKEDERTADRICALETILATMKAYRISLAERYAELETVPTIPVVKLSRVKASCYSKNAGRVFYYLETFDRYLNDGHEVETSSAEYPGTQRHKAIADYHEYVRTHPGIVAEMDIEKPKWER